MTTRSDTVDANRAARAREDRARLRGLVRAAKNAVRRLDAALTRGDPTPSWTAARLDEALGPLQRARNRALLAGADATLHVELDP